MERSSSTDLGRRFCDLVMKGGITSGVVYPRAIASLAETYRFRNIGGTSAGAIAAAGAAAAEYRRCKPNPGGNPNEGFQRLEGLHAELSREPWNDGRSRLFSLFAPSTSSKPLFRVLTAALNRKTIASRSMAVLWGLVLGFPLSGILGLLLGIAILWASWTYANSFTSALPPAAGIHLLSLLAPIVLVLVAVATALILPFVPPVLAAFKRLNLVMSTQNFGLVTGMRDDKLRPDEPALTEWLYELLQDLAGKPLDQPLTFGDLAGLKFDETPTQDGVTLRLVTTCATAGRPFTLPFENYFHFDPVELRRYMPEVVVKWMEDHPWRPRNDSDRKANELAAKFQLDGRDRPLVPLPESADLPVILAVRLSLSFPLLLSALRLYRWNIRTLEPDDPNGKNSYQEIMEPVYFTDGGVCSNMPVHMFDAPLPVWPTFAINLKDDLPEKFIGASYADRRIVDGEHRDSSRMEIYPIGRAGVPGTVDFLGAIVETMQNWRDVLQRAAPGTKDRVMTVRHAKSEGGLNLRMEKTAIEAMATSGHNVATHLIDGFVHSAGDPQKDRWNRHRWGRFRNLLNLFEDYVNQCDEAMTTQDSAPTGRDLLRNPQPYVASHYEMAEHNRTEAEKYLREIGDAAANLRSRDHDFKNRAPRPYGTVTIVPRF